MAIFYVIKHISRKHFVSLQRYKIKEKMAAHKGIADLWICGL